MFRVALQVKHFVALSNFTVAVQCALLDSPVVPRRCIVAFSSFGCLSVSCASVHTRAVQPWFGCVNSEPSVTVRSCELLLPHAAKPDFLSSFSSTDSFLFLSPAVSPIVSHESYFSTAICLISAGRTPPIVEPARGAWYAAATVSVFFVLAWPYMAYTPGLEPSFGPPPLPLGRNATSRRTVVE